MIYLLSFFIVENIFLLFLDQNNFNLIFLVVNVFWLVFLLFKNKNIFFQLKILLLVFLNNLFCRLFEPYLTINKNIIGDVKDIHYEHVKNIFEKGYYYSINNPTLEGYTQTAAYVHAVLNKLLFYTNEYNYISSSTNVLLFLFIFVIYEYNFSKQIKLLGILLFASLMLNSFWLSFLFYDSLMTEGILSYLFLIALISVLKERNTKKQI